MDIWSCSGFGYPAKFSVNGYSDLWQISISLHDYADLRQIESDSCRCKRENVESKENFDRIFTDGYPDLRQIWISDIISIHAYPEYAAALDIPRNFIDGYPGLPQIWISQRIYLYVWVMYILRAQSAFRCCRRHDVRSGFCWKFVEQGSTGNGAVKEWVLIQPAIPEF